MTKKEYSLFIKISQEIYIDKLQQKGHIYCNSLEFFRKLEGDDERKDINEGASKIRQGKDLVLKKDDKTLFTASTVQMFENNKGNEGHIFCLFGNDIDRKNKIRNLIIDAKNLGEFALVILDCNEFLFRIQKQLKLLGKDYKINPVNYYNSKKYSGNLSAFHKADSYSHQKEIRIWIPGNNKDPFEFYIGNIEDITRKVLYYDLKKFQIEIL